jgi:hypothetical protein
MLADEFEIRLAMMHSADLKRRDTVMKGKAMMLRHCSYES